MKMNRQTNNIECTRSTPRANQKWRLPLAALAGVALVAVGCSTDRHAKAEYSSSRTTYTASTEPTPPPTATPAPAVGAAETPSGQSSGYATTTSSSSGYS